MTLSEWLTAAGREQPGEKKKKLFLAFADMANTMSAAAARVHRDKNAAKESRNVKQTQASFHFSTWLIIFDSLFNWWQKAAGTKSIRVRFCSPPQLYLFFFSFSFS